MCSCVGRLGVILRIIPWIICTRGGSPLMIPIVCGLQMIQTGTLKVDLTTLGVVDLDTSTVLDVFGLPTCPVILLTIT